MGLTDKGLEVVQAALDDLAARVLAPGGWVALTEERGYEVPGTRVPWTGDDGYEWDGADLPRAAEVYGMVRVLEDGEEVRIGFAVAPKSLHALHRLALEPLGPAWRPRAS